MLAIHAGDLHLGVSSYGPANPTTGISRRVDDFFAAFDQAVDYAIEKKADLFLLCGDTFKDPSPTPTMLKMFATRLARLSKADIKTVIVLGNHDTPKSGRAAPPEPFIELDVPNVYFFSKPDFKDLECRSGEKVRVFAIPYRHPVKLASDKKKGTTKLDKDLLAEGFREQIAKEIEIFTRAGRKGADASILVGHLSVEGAVAGSEKIWATGEEYSVLPSAFDAGTFDYIALGHLHKHQVMKSKTPIVYSGSIERVDISEANEKKCFVSVNIRNHTAEWKFIDIQSRPMHNIRVDCTNQPDPLTSVKEELADKTLNGAIVSLHIVIKDQLPGAQRDEISRLLNNSFWNQIVYEKLARKPGPDSKGAFGGTLEPSQALGKYLKTKKIIEKERDLAMKIGQEIINETLAKVES